MLFPEVKVERTFFVPSFMSLCLSISLLSLHHYPMTVVSSPIPNSQFSDLTTLSTPDNTDNVDSSVDGFLASSETDPDSEQQSQSYILGQALNGHHINKFNLNISDLPASAVSSSQEAAWRAQVRKSIMRSGRDEASGGHEDDPEMRAGGTNSKSNTNTTTTTTTTTSLLLLSQNQSINSSVSLKSRLENCTLEPAFLCLMEDLVQFQRDKDLRLNAIKNYVMQKLGIAPKIPSRPSPERPTFLEHLNPSSLFSGQLQTLHASCDIPMNVDKEIWNTPEFFHIYFHIPPSVFSQQSQSIPIPAPIIDDSGSGSNERTFQAMMRASGQLNRNGQRNHNNLHFSNDGTVDNNIRRRASNERRGRGNSNIISAKLKMYKIGRGQEPTNIEVSSTSEPCNETMDGNMGETQPDVIINPLGNFPSVQTVDEKIRVSVYWYIKDYINPVKKHHFKKKLLDTKMLSVKESKWVEFDIQRAAIAWQQRNDNFGLIVQVENEDNEWEDAKKYFTGLVCPTDKEVEIMENNTADGNETKITQSEILTVLPPPVLEICTLSVPSTTTTRQPTPLNPNLILEAVEQQRELKNHHNRNRQVHRHRHNHGESRPHRAHHRHVNQTQGPSWTFAGPEIINNSTTNEIIKKEQSDNFQLDDDHPLRDILATVASSQSSNESRVKSSSHHHNHHNFARLDQDLNDSDYVDDNDDDVIIQKIYISSPVPTNQRHRSTNSRTNSNLNR